MAHPYMLYQEELVYYPPYRYRKSRLFNHIRIIEFEGILPRRVRVNTINQCLSEACCRNAQISASSARRGAVPKHLRRWAERRFLAVADGAGFRVADAPGGDGTIAAGFSKGRFPGGPTSSRPGSGEACFPEYGFVPSLPFFLNSVTKQQF